MRGSSYAELPIWIANQKAVINAKVNDTQCFRLAFIAGLHHEDISHHPERIRLIQHYENQHNQNGPEFPLEIRKMSKIEKSNR